MSKTVLFLGPQGFGTYIFDHAAGRCSRIDGPADTLLIPGFVDIHTHGAFGIDFMTAEPGQMAELCARLRAVGYEGFLPTTVTASPDDVSRALAYLPEHPMILGFHLEGPFISPKFPGAQPKSAIIDPPAGASNWDPILDDPRLKVITLAPEQPGGLELTRRLAKRGVRVSMGHTSGTYAEAAAGFAAGADHTTHTYNAMRPLHHREPGTVGFALTNDGVYTELIYDRLHVAKPAADVLVRCKPQDKIVAISDSTMAAGMPPGPIKMWNLDCMIGDREVRLLDGTLAGSAITLLDAFRNLHEDFGPEMAIRACCLNPRLSLGHSLESKLLVELDKNLSIVALHDATRH